MRPHPLPLPLTAHIRATPAVRRFTHPICGARQYARTAEVLSTNTFRSRDSKSSSAKITSCISGSQRRWITQAYLQRIADANAQWTGFAEEIKQGKRKSFVEHLEERELLHDAVGCVYYI